MSSSSSVTTICIRIECNKPCFIETNGRKHPFCGKTCAKIFISSNLSKCSNANCNRNKFIDPSDQKVYDYCGKTCARNTIHNNNNDNNNNRLCSRENCPKRAYVDLNDSTKYHSYCSSSCYWLETATLTQTKLTLLTPNDLDYDVAKGAFLNGIPNAKIHGIIRIQMPKIVVDAHQILKKNGLRSHKLFHGTKTICDPIDITRCLKTICNTGSVNQNCGVCGIITKGNDTGCSRHGGNMWFAQSSSTSLGYCSTDKGNKAMFLLDVLSNGSPNPGFLIVNQNAAALPRYLFIFSTH